MGILSRLFGGSGRGDDDRTVKILRRHLDADFTVFPLAENPVSLRQIEEIGARFGVQYPPEFCAHVLGQFPGIYIEVDEKIWPRPKEFEVGPFWSFLYGLQTYTSAPQSEGWMRLDVAAESFQATSGLKAAPILKVIGDADLYCIDAQGAILQYDHEVNNLSPVQMDFWALFDRELGELKARKLRKGAQS